MCSFKVYRNADISAWASFTKLISYKNMFTMFILIKNTRKVNFYIIVIYSVSQRSIIDFQSLMYVLLLNPCLKNSTSWKYKMFLIWVHKLLHMYWPIFIKTNDDYQKVWFSLLTCIGTGALHLELICAMTNSEILLCFRRYTAQRGRPTEVISDNSIHFKSESCVRSIVVIPKRSWQINLNLERRVRKYKIVFGKYGKKKTLYESKEMNSNKIDVFRFVFISAKIGIYRIGKKRLF